MRRGCTLSFHLIAGQNNAVVSGLRRFALFVIRRTPAHNRAVLLPCYRLQGNPLFGNRRHDKEIAQVAIPANATHLRHGKALDGTVLVAVSAAVVASCDGIGAYLHHAEGGGSTGKSLPQSVIHSCSINA